MSLRELGLSSLGKAQGDLTVYEHLKGGWKEEGSSSYLWCPVTGGGTMSQLETLEDPSKYPGVMESPSLEVFKAQGAPMSGWAQSRSLPAQPVCRCVILSRGTEMPG